MLTVHLPLIKKSSLVFLATFLIASCVQSPTEKANSDFRGCEIGEQCTMKGRLTLYVNSHGSLGVLNIEKNCAALSLPSHVYDRDAYWEGAVVRVEGVVYVQPSQPGIISYELEDRSVLAGMCESGKILYVTEVVKQR